MRYYGDDDCDLDAFRRMTSQTLAAETVPQASAILRNVPLYDMSVLGANLADPAARRALMVEWASVLRDGAGVVVLKRAYPDPGPIDRATEVFRAIIAEERAGAGGKGDHFAASGANDRVWNALQKHCLRDPAGFALYYGNAAIAAVCEAWLGPDYQMTAQVNQVRPGGKAQSAHRDYHLGFQTAEGAARFPGHVHDLTATLTLQGGIAHVDMPVASGPTKLLPFSQGYGPGYLAFHRPDFRDWFEDRCVQVPLDKGDAVFFSPALFHAAGENRTSDVHRMVNLLQVSSAFGRAMEAIDRLAMTRAIYPVLLQMAQAGTLDPASLDAAIAATAEGYSFPTNLDTDPPLGGLAPESQAALVRRAIRDVLTPAEVDHALAAQAARRLA